ncbi:MAG: Ig-like domain-containing protein [Lachnospiraceae bacterium]|nr:Ig-like domain-containing protein [Lachnospiraceae bacterium]
MRRKKNWLTKGLLLLGIGICVLGNSSTQVNAKQVGEYKGIPIFDNKFGGEEITDGATDASVRRSGATYAAKYDPRTTMSKIEDQGNTNTCWAFATVAAVEANLIKKGYVNGNVDLSENQLAYFFYNRKNDPLGNTDGDGNACLASPYWYMNGGTLQGTALSLMTWSGLVNATTSEDYAASEATQDIIAGMYKPYTPAAATENQRDYVVKSVQFYNNDVRTIKQAILDYGGVAAGFWADYNCYLSDDTTSYYCPVSDNSHTHAGGHAITIVGWDDNYSRNHFASGCRPSNNGAWIVKNSYGTYFGENGYMYISYEDASLTEMVTYDVEPVSSVEDNNYQYDGSAAPYSLTIRSDATFANVFRAKASGSGCNETLKAVAVNTFTNNIRYKVQIYTGVTSTSKPTKGKLVLTQTGSLPVAGYNRINLKSPVTLTSGEKYSVVITVSSASGSLSMGVEAYGYNSWIGFRVDADENVGYIKVGKQWMDCGDAYDVYDKMGSAETFNLRIKAYTDTTTEKTSYKLSEKAIGISKGSSQKLSLKITPTSVKRNATWTSSNKKVATVSSNGKVKAKAYGTATIKATFVAGKKNKTLTCKVTVGPSKVKNLKVSGGKKKITVKWSKNSQASGYEISYSKNKTSGYKTLATIKSGGTTSYTKKKLSAGTYYVKVRPYMTQGGKKLYGSYTGVKTVKVK